MNMRVIKSSEYYQPGQQQFGLRRPRGEGALGFIAPVAPEPMSPTSDSDSSKQGEEISYI